MNNLTKNQKEVLKKYDLKNLYSIEEAVKNVKDVKSEKFDSSIRLSFNLNVDPRHADQMIRGVTVLPHSNGKVKRILAIVEDEKIEEAKRAKADFVGGENMITKIQQEKWYDFDIIVTTPQLMQKVGRLGKILGPKGLMPNPKLGTVTNKVEKAIEDIKKGQLEYRVDKDGNINVMIGKSSFEDKVLVENYNSMFNTIKKERPHKVKGKYINNIVISSTMGPGFKIKF